MVLNNFAMNKHPVRAIAGKQHNDCDTLPLEFKLLNSGYLHEPGDVALSLEKDLPLTRTVRTFTE
jgi:hypothetical protein